MADQDARDQLKSVMKEAMKVYREYDGSNRLEFQFEAPVAARDGDPCLKTQYVYDGVSTRVVKMKETQDTWSSAYEV